MTRYMVGRHDKLFGFSDETTFVIDKYFKKDDNKQPSMEKYDMEFVVQVLTEYISSQGIQPTQVIDIYKPLEQRILEKELKLLKF